MSFAHLVKMIRLDPGQVFEPPYRQIIDDPQKAPASLAEASEFVELLIKHVGSEKDKDEGKKASRVKALGLVKTFLTNPKSTAYDDAEVSAAAFAVQLACRIREPSMINQGQASICGPNTLMIQVAKTTPERYAVVALALFQHGKANFDALDLEAPDIEKTRDWARELSLVDHIVLVAASRGFANSFMRALPSSALQGNAPDTVKSALEKAGFKHCQDNTISNWLGFGIGASNVTDKSRANLAQAAKAVSAGHCVIMFYGSELVSLITNQLTATFDKDIPRKPGQIALPASEGKASRPDHYSLVSKLQLNDKTTEIKLYSWGRSYTATLPTDSLLTYYAGYISGELNT
ncbi:MAG: hypothetical protein QM776_04680 [Rhodocyclaceae bacterium]